MIVSMFHVSVPPQAMEPFERSWRQRAGKVDAMPGFRGLEVLRAGDTPGDARGLRPLGQQPRVRGGPRAHWRRRGGWRRRVLRGASELGDRSRNGGNSE